MAEKSLRGTPRQVSRTSDLSYRFRKVHGPESLSLCAGQAWEESHRCCPRDDYRRVFERILAEGKKPRTAEEHLIAIYQYLIAAACFEDLDLSGVPIYVGGSNVEVPRLLKVALYAATEETNDPSGVFLDTLDNEWMSPEGLRTHPDKA